MSKLTPTGSSKTLRVGFDLDGVLLYNPARIARMPIAFLKRTVFKKKGIKFYYPKRPWEQAFWRLCHLSSLFIASGFKEIEKLAKKNKIEAYIITGRYDFLEHDFNRWLKKINNAGIFKNTYLNKNNEQPHLFKEKMIKKLNLHAFVEDNFDIASHLTDNTGAKIFWIYNIFDRTRKHPNKFPTLKKTVEEIKKLL